MTYDDLLTNIYARGRFGIKPGLERISALLASLGDPQCRLKSVHIAGTNGKGSTGAFLSSILTAAGCRTAFFSSPHLVRFTERFRINDREVTEKRLYEVAVRVVAAASEDVTFFEIVTAIAMLLFAEESIEIAIIETGMGGRWDATNVITPLVSVITPVSLDHCAYLGGTRALIAAEKAGIIKRGVPVVSAPQDKDALETLLAAAAAAGSRVYLHGRDYFMETAADGLVYSAGDFSLSGLQLSLKGLFQSVNAASAITAATLLRASGYTINGEIIRYGLSRAIWPGRLELFAAKTAILLDGAHNPAGVAALVESLAGFHYNRLFLVVGVMADKEWQEVVKPLLGLAWSVVTVCPAIDRGLDAEELARFCLQQGVDAAATPSVSDGIDSAAAMALPDDLLLITGSLFTVGEARAYLTGGSFMPVRG